MLKARLVRWLSRTCLERGTANVTEMSVTLATDIGMVRSENQDRVAVMRVTTRTAKPFIVIALVDGMGGMNYGSECAIEALAAFFDALSRFRGELPKERLSLAANFANMETYKISKGRGGATLSALLVSTDHEPLVLNIGDSRIYSTSNKDKESEVIRLTVDDSLEEAVGGHGKDLLQFVGMGDGLIPHIDVVPKNTKRILVTSDGIHFINQECLREVLLNARNSVEVAEHLSAFARMRGTPDNATLAIGDLRELSQFLSSDEEPGIELWDPFGALHVIWLKQDQPGTAQSPALIKEEKSLKKNIARPKKPPVNKKSTKKATKATPEPKDIPELILDVDPEVIDEGKGK
jgi:serine/threonine protein phosphatase PrpC